MTLNLLLGALMVAIFVISWLGWGDSGKFTLLDFATFVASVVGISLAIDGRQGWAALVLVCGLATSILDLVLLRRRR